MKYKVFTVYDSKAEAYLVPFFMQNENMAIRSFTDSLKSPETPFHRHPQDYTLFHIGEYSDREGLLEAAVPMSLGNGLEFLGTKEEA